MNLTFANYAEMRRAGIVLNEDWAASIFFQKVGWPDEEFLRNRERPPFTSFANIPIGEEAYERAWQSEHDRRFLLRPACHIETEISRLLRPSQIR